jgi:ELWxxDGT repeat protein
MNSQRFVFHRALICCSLLIAAFANAGQDQAISLGDMNVGQIQKSAVGPGASDSFSGYFAGADTEHGTELWRYNGGSASLWKDVRPGPESSNPSQFTSVGSYVVYVADNGVHGPELYTTANISVSGFLGDVQPGTSHAAPVILGASNGWLWFTTDATGIDASERFSTELWVTDGFNAPQKRGVFAANSLTQVTVLTARATGFFLARELSDATGIVNLYRVDGSGNPVFVNRLRTNPNVPVPASPVYAATTNFVCFQSIDINNEPRLYTLSSGALSTLADIVPGSGGSLPTHFVSNGTDRICFAATSANGREVWTTLGSTVTTTLLADVTAGAASSNPTVLIMSRGNPGIFFQVENGAARDLYYAEAGATPVFRLCDSDVGNTTQPTMVSGTELACLKPAPTLFRVRLADGKTGNTFNTGPSFASVARLWNSSTATPMSSAVYLTATQTSVEELYRLTGGDVLKITLPTPPGGSAKPRNFFPFGPSEHLFVGSTNTQPTLYRLNSGSATAVPMDTPSDSFASNASSLAADFSEVAGMLFFTAYDGHDRRLFQSSTGQQNSAAAVSGIYDPEQLVVAHGRLYLLARPTAGGTGVKKLFGVEIMGANYTAELVGSPTGYNATALKVAAGQLFFVEEHTSSIERLNVLDSSLTVTTISAFYKDPSGKGIAQLTASSGHLYFTAQQDSSPSAKRVIWGTDGTPASLTTLGASIFNPQLLGALGDACIFWFDPGTGSQYQMFNWESDVGGGPYNFLSSSNFNTPETHRLSSTPSGVEYAGWFYYTLQSGRLLRTNGVDVEVIFDNQRFAVRAEFLATLPDKLVFSAVRDDFVCRFFRYSLAEGYMSEFWSSPQPSMPCPLVAIGSKLHFTTCEFNSNIGTTQLWRTDGTNTGTQLVIHNLAQRKLANVPMGVYRGHLALTAARNNGSDSMEPALLNATPSIPQPLTFQGLRAQPVSFNYAQLVTGPATDADGDTLTPVRLFNSYGILTRNGNAVPTSTDIAPGDTFEWTPPPTHSGVIFPFFLYCSDDWQEGTTYCPINLQTPYDVWRAAQFPVVEGEPDPPQNSAPYEDFNANGLPNIFEQLFGRDPRAPDSTPGWVPSVTGGGTVMRYTFTRAATLPQGTVLTVECSPDLTPFSWNPVATKIENAAWTGVATVSETTLLDGRVRVDVDTPISANCGFFRLQVAY